MDVTTLCLALGLVSASPSLSPLPEDRVEFACQQMETLVTESEAEGFDPTVMAALIYVESRWTPTAVSHAGACGLTQVIPRYVDESCKELKEPTTSIRVGAKSLKKWTTKRVKRNGRLVRVPRSGGLREALACYNAGNACLKSSRGAAYASTVLRHAKRLRRAYSQIDADKETDDLQNLGYAPTVEDAPRIIQNDWSKPAEFYFPAWVPSWVNTRIVTL